MKKAFLFLLIIFPGFFLFSEEISKTYRFSEYVIEEIDGYQLIQFDGCMHSALTGSPSLPWFAVKVLLPPGEKAISFTVNGSKEQHIQGKYTLYPQQASRPLSYGPSGEFSYNAKAYRSNEVYPAEAHGIISTEYMNGYSIAILNICPLRYIPANGNFLFIPK